MCYLVISYELVVPSHRGMLILSMRVVRSLRHDASDEAVFFLPPGKHVSCFLKPYCARRWTHAGQLEPRETVSLNWFGFIFGINTLVGHDQCTAKPCSRKSFSSNFRVTLNALSKEHGIILSFLTETNIKTVFWRKRCVWWNEKFFFYRKQIEQRFISIWNCTKQTTHDLFILCSRKVFALSSVTYFCRTSSPLTNSAGNINIDNICDTNCTFTHFNIVVFQSIFWNETKMKTKKLFI